MHSTLSAPERVHEHPPQPAAAREAATRVPVRRVSILDRLALRAGLALITWSRRPLAPRERDERRATRREARLARERREREWLRDWTLLVPPR